MFTLQKTQRGLIAALVIAISALYFISSARLQVRNGLGTAFNPGRVLAPDLLSRQVNEAPMNVTATSDDPTFSLNHTVDESALRLPYEPNNFNIDDVRRLLGPPSGLAKRQEMSAYETCICKGIFMLARVRAGGHASNTPWRTMQQAEDNGWVSEDILWSDYPTAVFPANLKTPYQSLGISSTKRSNPKYGFLQSKEYLTINGEEKEPTTAYFYSIFNVEAGSLIALSNVGPGEVLQNEEHTIPPEIIKTLVPKVSRWSDLVWIQWSNTAKGKAKDLKYIWRDAVVTPSTKAIMEETVHQQGGLNLPWPGKDFTMNDIEGMALLGTIHGMGIGWMLSDHRDQIQKEIATVKIWNAGVDYQMLWTLKDP